jgi:hypothetical protein
VHLLLPKERGGGHGRGTVMNVNQFQAFCPAPEFGGKMGGGNDSMGLYNKNTLGRRRRSLHLLGWVIDVHMLLLRQERAGERQGQGPGQGRWLGTTTATLASRTQPLSIESKSQAELMLLRKSESKSSESRNELRLRDAAR